MRTTHVSPQMAERVVGNYIYSLLGCRLPTSADGYREPRGRIAATRCPTFHGDTIYGETRVLGKTPSRSKPDRGVVHVETIGYKQDGTVVCIFRRKVLVPTREVRRSARRWSSRVARNRVDDVPRSRIRSVRHGAPGDERVEESGR